MRPHLLELLTCPWSGTALELEALDRDGDVVRHGVLRSEADEFPVIAGIPVLRPGTADLVDLVRRGEHDLAARRAAFGEIPPAGALRLGPWLAATGRLAPVGHRLVDRHTAAIDRASTPLTDPEAGPRDLFDLAYRRLRLRNPEVYAYNWFRFGVPRHLAALAALEWAPPTGPVLDLACGAGHLTWALARHVAPDPVIGVDGLFFALYVARTRLAPDADFVCCDLDALPFRDDALGGVWASDVVHALARKVGVARELARVARPGSWGVIAGLAVAGHPHEYPGRPLSLAGYRGLWPEDATLVADDELLAGYLDRRAADPHRPGDLAAAPVVTALWAADGGRPGLAFPDWPHGRGRLGPNPLFVPDGRTDDGTRVHLELPTPAYEREHGALRAYTADAAVVTDDAVAAARAAGRGPALERLVEDFVVLGLPEGYQHDPWAGFGAGG